MCENNQDIEEIECTPELDDLFDEFADEMDTGEVSEEEEEIECTPELDYLFDRCVHEMDTGEVSEEDEQEVETETPMEIEKALLEVWSLMHNYVFYLFSL